MERVLTVAALAIATVVAAFIVIGGERDYRVRMRLVSASQLVNGNLVKVGGREVGEIERIELTRDNQAELTVKITDGAFRPLHAGTRATVRQTSLSGVANRYVALAPGPNNAPAIADGGVIDAESTRAIVDLDAVLNTLDIETRESLKRVVRANAVTFTGAEAEANAALEALNPALGETAATMRELTRDEEALERAIVELAALVSALEPVTPELEQTVEGAAGALEAVAGERAALAATLDRAPETLRRANTTLLNLRGALAELRPALEEARPVAPRLARTLRTLAPLARRARPTVRDLRTLVPDLRLVLQRLPRTERIATPAFASATSALARALPVVAAARPYTPDLVAGLLNGFGGATAGYYDANGRYTRVSVQGGPYSLNNSGSLIPVPPSDGGLSGYRSRLFARCPGAAAQPHPDRSNPHRPPEAPCRPEDDPPAEGSAP